MKTALVTGSCRGFGRELALRFADAGVGVILNGLDAGRLQSVAAEVRGRGADCEVVAGDLTHEDTLGRLAEASVRRDVDALINNAGIYANERFDQITDEAFRRMIDVNLIAPVLLIRRIWPIFARKQAGVIVNINSVAGKTGSAGESAYCASKHGLRGFARSLQFDATREHIRVIDVFLGTMNTGMVEGRREPEKCIQTEDAADLVFRLCKDYPSMRIEEVHVSRRRY